LISEVMPVEFEISGATFSLDPSGALYWASESALLLADLHLGKETVFQKSGIAIPQGATSSTLSGLRRLVERYQAKQIIVLGDLLHAPIGLTQELSDALASLVRDWGDCRWVLVPGNHDRGAISALRQCGWEITEKRYQVDGVCLTHDTSRWSKSDPSSVSGHLHPSIRVPLSARESKRVRCFWLRGEHLVIPAFGGWTGTHPIRPTRSDQIVVCADGDLIRLSDLRTA
jgi:DNA ligase-associated metallophosphoesterase